eukprot:1169058-Alexandrium_andersonii.AAC.1
MSASLVGSEMCIRDRSCTRGYDHAMGKRSKYSEEQTYGERAAAGSPFVPVSYTHLTLPTICSV